MLLGTIISSFGEKIGPLAESGFNKVGKILSLEALSRNPDGQFALSAKGRSHLTHTFGDLRWFQSCAY